MSHRPAEWYRDAKLGIMVHWGVPTVPAWAPVEHGGLAEILRDHDWQFYFRHNPYAEWYLNSLRIPDSPVRAYHRRHFGTSSYERLARRFSDDLDRWDPGSWADLFREAGARYVVFVAKHHDGYLMWPSSAPPVTPSFVAPRDVVGELGEAVRERGMRYGLYYSGLLDWTVQHGAIREFSDLLLAETDAAYERTVKAHFAELIDRYRPDLLWNDIGLPGGVSRRSIFRHYRDAVPEGVLNDRWAQTGAIARMVLGSSRGRRAVERAARTAILEGRSTGRHGDVATVEYASTLRDSRRPWELVRGLGRSFAYNAAEPPESYLTGTDLISLLVDVVSRNGNLLLNVAPAADGSISREQRAALTSLATWLRDHGESIYGTRPWVRSSGRTADGLPVRYTATRDALYAHVIGRPRMLSLAIEALDLRRVPRPRERRDAEQRRFSVDLLGCDRPVSWRSEGGRVVIDLPGSFVAGDVTVVRFAWRRSPEPPASGFYTDLI